MALFTPAVDHIVAGRLGAEDQVVAHILLDESVAIMTADDRVGQVHVLDLGLQLSPILLADLATEDDGDLVRLADGAVGVEERRTITIGGGVCFILAIAVSRLLLYIHTPSEVGLGLVIGAAALPLFGQAYPRCPTAEVWLSPLHSGRSSSVGSAWPGTQCRTTPTCESLSKPRPEIALEGCRECGFAVGSRASVWL